MIPAAGAAFTVSAIGHFFHRHDYHKILRPAVLIGFLGYVSVVLILILDLGRWHQFYSILLPARINLHSFLEEVALSVTLYTMVLILELAPTILENRIIHLPRDRELDRPDGTGLDDLPHWMEVTSSVGIAAGAMLAYIIIARAFNLFPEEHAHEVSA
jgi:Ni/Fe-hydrogenase subunit HybB-like protein